MLLKFIENQLKPPAAQQYLQGCLREALEGLHALGYGEAMPIFTPRKTNDHGATPYSALKFRMKAVGFVDLLCKKGYKAGIAQAKVAGAYGVSGETIKDWQQDPGKIGDSWMQNFRKKIANSTDWSHRRVRDELTDAAKKYIVANKKKKENKTSAKNSKKTAI